MLCQREAAAGWKRPSEGYVPSASVSRSGEQPLQFQKEQPRVAWYVCTRYVQRVECRRLHSLRVEPRITSSLIAEAEFLLSQYYTVRCGRFFGLPAGYGQKVRIYRIERKEFHGIYITCEGRISGDTGA